MGPGQAVGTCIARRREFSGRAGRAEFWWFALAVAVAVAAGLVLDGLLFGSGTLAVDLSPRFPLTGLVLLAAALPLLAAAWRRLHDGGLPGWPAALPLAVLIPAGALLILAGPARGGQDLAVLLSISLAAMALTVTAFLLARPSDPGANRFGRNPVR